MSKLTRKQQLFADEYIISSNATDAAIKAGYSKKTATKIASENLTKPDIISYIKEKTVISEQLRADTIEEVIAKGYSIARGEPQKVESWEEDPLTGERNNHTIKYYTPHIKDSLTSADQLYKLKGLFIEKQQIEHSGSVQFIDDLSDTDE